MFFSYVRNKLPPSQHPLTRQNSIYMQQKVLQLHCSVLFSRSSLETVTSLDIVGTKLYCFMARVHCLFVYHFLNQSCETFLRASWRPVQCSEKSVRAVCCSPELHALASTRSPIKLNNYEFQVLIQIYLFTTDASDPIPQMMNFG